MLILFPSLNGINVPASQLGIFDMLSNLFFRIVSIGTGDLSFFLGPQDQLLLLLLLCCQGPVKEDHPFPEFLQFVLLHFLVADNYQLGPGMFFDHVPRVQDRSPRRSGFNLFLNDADRSWQTIKEGVHQWINDGFLAYGA